MKPLQPFEIRNRKPKSNQPTVKKAKITPAAIAPSRAHESRWCAEESASNKIVVAMCKKRPITIEVTATSAAGEKSKNRPAARPSGAIELFKTRAAQTHFRSKLESKSSEASVNEAGISCKTMPQKRLDGPPCASPA